METQAMAKILVVEDDETLLDTLVYSLTHEGYTVITAADGQAALAQARAEQPDLILLDLMLPKLDGLSVTRILRTEMETPILMLTAKADEIDTIVGLEVGADDYITKPFRFRELLARIRVALRRVERSQPLVVASPASTLLPHERLQTAAPLVLDNGALVIDVARHEVHCRGEHITLTPKEFDLLAFLATNHGIVVSREILLNHVWGYDYPGDARTVDVHIRWLREKLEVDPSQPASIETVRGRGYRLNG